MPKATASETTRGRLVRVAMQLFGEKGYGGTSVADLLARADLHAGSLYHFFDTKQDLLLAVLDAYREGIHRMLLEPAWRGVADPVERIFALLAAYRRLLVASDCTYGCPIGSLALELHEPDPPVRQRLAANFDAWVAAVESCLHEAKDRLPRGLDRRGLAVLVLSVMEGAVMQARTQRSLAPFDESVRSLRDYFNLLERGPAPAAGRPRARRAR